MLKKIAQVVLGMGLVLLFIIAGLSTLGLVLAVCSSVLSCVLGTPALTTLEGAALLVAIGLLGGMYAFGEAFVRNILTREADAEPEANGPVDDDVHARETQVAPPTSIFVSCVT